MVGSKCAPGTAPQEGLRGQHGGWLSARWLISPRMVVGWDGEN